jgi:hypothetical protein
VRGEPLGRAAQRPEVQQALVGDFGVGDIRGRVNI